ncbi:MAG: hypothetical protein DRJ50_09475 [Actinobacteria bacterium]|nr:MAG: hypothetical protein DRJ50_09475 [Actinomycetota bacterium]
MLLDHKRLKWTLGDQVSGGSGPEPLNPRSLLSSYSPGSFAATTFPAIDTWVQLRQGTAQLDAETSPEWTLEDANFGVYKFSGPGTFKGDFLFVTSSVGVDNKQFGYRLVKNGSEVLLGQTTVLIPGGLTAVPLLTQIVAVDGDTFRIEAQNNSDATNLISFYSNTGIQGWVF